MKQLIISLVLIVSFKFSYSQTYEKGDVVYKVKYALEAPYNGDVKDYTVIEIVKKHNRFIFTGKQVQLTYFIVKENTYDDGKYTEYSVMANDGSGGSLEVKNFVFKNTTMLVDINRVSVIFHISEVIKYK